MQAEISSAIGVGMNYPIKAGGLNEQSIDGYASTISELIKTGDFNALDHAFANAPEGFGLYTLNGTDSSAGIELQLLFTDNRIGRVKVDFNTDRGIEHFFYR